VTPKRDSLKIHIPVFIDLNRSNSLQLSKSFNDALTDILQRRHKLAYFRELARKSQIYQGRFLIPQHGSGFPLPAHF
jgi:hypothetical protein